MTSKFDVKSKTWRSDKLPDRVLFIRLHALGDVVISLPYIQGFREKYPDIKVDLLTRKEVADIPASLNIFDKIWIMNGGRNRYWQLAHLLLMLPFIISKRYAVVFDIQNHKFSRLVRFCAFPSAWTQFDMYSANSAGSRYLETIKAIKLPGIDDLQPSFDFQFGSKNKAQNILERNGWNNENKLFVINPAGHGITRNWPLDNYVLLISKLADHYSNRITIVILGIQKIKEKAGYIRKHVHVDVIELIEKTTPVEAFQILSKSDLILTEDSGLMHMAWVQGVPTVALFGSSRSDWSAPQGKHSLVFDSSDLACGNCLLSTCIHGDVRCLTRYTPEHVFLGIIGHLKSLSEQG